MLFYKQIRKVRRGLTELTDLTRTEINEKKCGVCTFKTANFEE